MYFQTVGVPHNNGKVTFFEAVEWFVCSQKTNIPGVNKYLQFHAIRGVRSFLISHSSSGGIPFRIIAVCTCVRVAASIPET